MEALNNFIDNLNYLEVPRKIAKAIDGFTEKCEAETKAIRKAEKLMDQYSEMGLEIKKLMDKVLEEAKQNK